MPSLARDEELRELVGRSERPNASTGRRGHHVYEPRHWCSTCARNWSAALGVPHPGLQGVTKSHPGCLV